MKQPLGKLLKWAVCVFSVAILATSLYALWKQSLVSNVNPIAAVTTGRKLSQTPAANTTVSDDDVTSWISYRNNSLGFEIKHPSSWDIYATENKIKIGDQRIQNAGVIISYSESSGLDLISWIRTNYKYQNVPSQPNLVIDSHPAIEICAWTPDNILDCAVYLVEAKQIVSFTFISNNMAQNEARKLYGNLLKTFHVLN
jgi:hypothetical protein